MVIEDHPLELHQAATGDGLSRSRGRWHGVMGMDLKDEDYIEHLFVASTHDYILFFTNVGKVYS